MQPGGGVLNIISGGVLRYIAMKHIIYTFIAFILASCISDDISTSPSHLPVFSDDTLRLGEIWADELSPTAALTVYNPHSAGIIISSVTVTGHHAECIKLNIDGSPFLSSPVEIRQGDSICLLAAAHPVGGGSLDATVNITVNSVTLSLPVAASVAAPQTLRDCTVAESLTLSGSVRVFGTLTVAPEAVLTIAPGTVIYMHDGAEIIVNGTLLAAGTPERQITIQGDRSGYLAADIPYSILPGQWKGITFSSSTQSELECVSVLNTQQGIAIGEKSSLLLTNCCVANSRGNLIALGEGAQLTAAGCQFTEAAGAVLAINSATARLYRCTIANNYLFAAPSSAAITLEGAASVSAAASIIYRPGAEISPADISSFDAVFTNCLFGSSGNDDAQFVSSMWGTDPLFLLDLETYRFDYRLSPDSPARISSLSSSWLKTDRFGVPEPQNLPLGAYN